jgi:hypothetical protein
VPLPHVMPRCHGFDCTPEYLIIGGLVFCHLTCPMLHVKKQVRRHQGSSCQFCSDGLLLRDALTVLRLRRMIMKCVMLHVQARKSQALYNMINFEFVENFVTEEQVQEKHVVLIEILADSLNYGYSGHAWRVLDAVNGCHIKDLAQLAELYRSFKGEYFVFEFSVVRMLTFMYRN